MSKQVQVTQATQATPRGQVINLHAVEPQQPLSAVDESTALRLTYLDDSGSLHRATLSTSSRLREICSHPSKIRLFKARLTSALSIVGMRVTDIEPVGSVFIELL